MYDNASAKVEGNTDMLAVELYDNSNLKAEKVEATKVVAYLEGSPNTKLKAIEEFDLSSKGSAKTQLYGNPKIVIKNFLDTSQLHKEN